MTVSGSSRERAEGKRRKHVQAAHCVLHCGRSGTIGTEWVSMFWVQICTDLSWTKGSVTHLNTWDKATSWEICLFASFFFCRELFYKNNSTSTICSWETASLAKADYLRHNNLFVLTCTKKQSGKSKTHHFLVGYVLDYFLPWSSNFLGFLLVAYAWSRNRPEHKPD